MVNPLLPGKLSVCKQNSKSFSVHFLLLKFRRKCYLLPTQVFRFLGSTDRKWLIHAGFNFVLQGLDVADRLVFHRNLALFFDPYRREILFTLRFLVFFAVLNYGYWLIQQTPVEDFILAVMTAKPPAFIINLLTPQDHIALNGTDLTSQYATFKVIRGCEAMGGMLLIIAAICATNVQFKRKLLGLLYGVTFIYFLNMFRIVGLYYIMRNFSSVFDFVHTFVGQSFVIILGCGFFTWWISRNTETNEAKLGA